MQVCSASKLLRDALIQPFLTVKRAETNRIFTKIRLQTLFVAGYKKARVSVAAAGGLSRVEPTTWRV